MRGFLTGIVSGVLVSGLGLVAAERYLPVIDLKLPAPDAGEVAVPAGSEFNTELPDAPPILPGTEAPVDSAGAPMVATPVPESGNLPDTTPLDAPQAAPLAETGLAAPEEAPTPVIVSGDNVDGLALPGLSQPDAPQIDVAAATPEATLAPETAQAPVTLGAPETAEAPEAAQMPEVVDAPETAMVPETPIAAIDAPPVSVLVEPQGLRLPVPEIEDMAPGVTTDRLPRIGPDVTRPANTLGMALSRNAIAFENAAGSPLISLILVDVGDVRPAPSVLADFPVPLTVALDPTAPDATALMQAYRQAGLEVAILTPLPEGAAPADVEVAFQSFFAALPEAVVIMDLPEAVLQESRPRAAQVVEILADSGHGLVTYDKGLNTVMQIASQASVPAATVFRDIDPGTHDVAAMKRFLDQAAFRAGLDGKVILKAEARPETLTALAEWSLGSRAASVVFAPISALLRP